VACCGGKILALSRSWTAARRQVAAGAPDGGPLPLS
jgi:hypothetical protein